MAEESEIFRVRLKSGYRVDAQVNRLSFYHTTASGEVETGRFSLPEEITALCIAVEKDGIVKLTLKNGTIGWACPVNGKVTPFYSPSLLSSTGFRRMLDPFMAWVRGDKVDMLVREMPQYQHQQFRDLIDRGVEPLETDRNKEFVTFLKDLGAMIAAEVKRMEQNG